jgi:hypothetical protein
MALIIVPASSPALAVEAASSRLKRQDGASTTQRTDSALAGIMIDARCGTHGEPLCTARPYTKNGYPRSPDGAQRNPGAASQIPKESDDFRKRRPHEHSDRPPWDRRVALGVYRLGDPMGIRNQP